MDTVIFEELGLTGSEIKVYLSLLKMKKSRAGPIIEKTGLQMSVVHRALNSLIEKGLVNFVLEGKKKLYQATRPENFLDFIDDKKKKFENILPELKKLENFREKEETATVFKGIRGIKEAYAIMLASAGKEYLTFGGGPITVEIMGMPWWMNLHERRIAKKLPARQVWDLAVKQAGADKIASKKLTRVRYLSKEFAQFQETVIVGDWVAINVFSQTPYSLVIKDKMVAEGYKKYFELLWKEAK